MGFIIQVNYYQNQESQTLSEMYFESLHYQIPELTSHICSRQSLANIFQLFGSKNPFQTATGTTVAAKRLWQ